MTAVARMFPRHGMPSPDLGASDASEWLSKRQREAEAKSGGAASDPYATPSDTFGELVAEWREETKFFSSAREIVSHPAYLRIIGLGAPAIPLVLKELSRNADHWYVALAALTGADPVSPDDWGDLEAMRDAWLKWARQRNLP